MGWSSFWSQNGGALWVALGQHILMSFGSVLLGILAAVPLGIVLSRHRRQGAVVIAALGVIQTVPSLALLGFALPFLGIGIVPAIVVLFLYSILPVLRNTYTALCNVDPAAVEAGSGMGMTPRQLLYRVELPLARPVIVAGIRLSTVYIISWATLAAFIGAGGLGDLILAGLATYDSTLIIAGAVPAALLALGSNLLFNQIERMATPPGLRQDAREVAA